MSTHLPVSPALLTLALAVSTCFTAACHAAEPQGPVRILFAGSDDTYMHNMPNQVAQWLQHHGGYKGCASPADRQERHWRSRLCCRDQLLEEPDATDRKRDDSGEHLLARSTTISSYRWLLISSLATRATEFDQAVDTYCRGDSGGWWRASVLRDGLGPRRVERSRSGSGSFRRPCETRCAASLPPARRPGSESREIKPDLELRNLARHGTSPARWDTI